MPIVYQVITNNYLPITKKVFDNLGEAILYIKEVVKKKEKWVKSEQVHKSYVITQINTDNCVRVHEIFLQSNKTVAPNPPTTTELGMRRPRRSKEEIESSQAITIPIK